MTGVLRVLAAVGLDDGLPGRDRIERAIAEVLARREFLPPELSWWDRFKAWVGEKIFDGLRYLFGAIDLDTTLGKLIVAFLVISLLAILGHLVYTVVRATKKERPETLPSQGVRLASGGTAQDALAAARGFAAAGAFTDAMHALYRAALLWLDERGQARFDPSKTAGDYRREIAAAEARRAFGALVEVFEPVAWGGRPASSAAWQRMRARAVDLGVPP